MAINTPTNYTKHDIKKRGSLKWAVGKPDSRRSTTWCLKGDKKGDIYLFANNAGGEWKISIHRDRNCHYGLTADSEDAKENFNLKSRHLDKWKLPSNPAVRAISIMIPESELAYLQTENDNPSIWIDAPKKEMAVIFSLYIEESNETSISLNLSPHVSLLGTIETNSRRSYLTYSYVQMDSSILNMITTTKEHTRTHLLNKNTAEDADKLRILLSLTFNTTERCFVEVDIP